MAYFKFCVRCGKRFNPSGKFARICLKCHLHQGTVKRISSLINNNKIRKKKMENKKQKTKKKTQRENKNLNSINN